MKRTKRVAFAICLLAAFMTQPALVAAATPDPTGSDATARANLINVSNGQMPAKTYEEFKRFLDKHPDFTRSDAVSGDTRTMTYTYVDGSIVVLSEPVKGKTAGISPQFAFPDCGWFQICIGLDPSEQSALLAGGTALVIIALCTPPGTPWCLAAGVFLPAATAWLSSHPLCAHYLVYTVFPVPGQFRACY